MTIVLYEGAAGTGKTTSLLDAATTWLTNHELDEGQRILLLTFMHGARWRLERRVRQSNELRGRAECATLDSVVWRLLCRWRGLVGVGLDALAIWGLSFDERCQHAAMLLERENVRDWLRRTYPLLLVDEFQDLDAHRLAFIKSMAGAGDTFLAADDFQVLGEHNPLAGIEWARAEGEAMLLENVHRTGVADLLATAGELRAGRPIDQRRQSCRVLGALNANPAAGMIANNLVWHGSNGTAILTPTRPANAPFARAAVDRLTSRPITTQRLGREVGPFAIRWEARTEAAAQRLIRSIDVGSAAGTSVPIEQLELESTVPGTKLLRDWLERERRIRGRTAVELDDLEEACRRSCQQLCALRSTPTGPVAMTVHQAKNREFDRVIVLWPYQVAGGVEKQRRLLYNAITRARQRALIIVQDNNRYERLNRPPFA